VPFFDQIPAQRDGAQSFRLRCPRNAIQDFTMSQRAEELYISRRIKKVKKTHRGAQQPDGRLTDNKALAVC
jgi:hypothetical protein